MVLTVDKAIEEMVPIMNKRQLVIFAGSGVSVPSGLPTWDDLIDKLIALTQQVHDLLPADARFDDILKDAQDQKSKYPSRVASVLKKQINHIQAERPDINVSKLFRSLFFDLLANKEPNQYHDLIVQTDYPIILTTNYDNLLELAARRNGYTELWASSFSFKDSPKVASALYGRKAAIIHVHGDDSSIAIEDFVFTFEDYQRIKKQYPGFTMALQSIFITYSVLFVGYGASDPHLEDFVEEMSYLMDWSIIKGLPRYFLALKKEKVGHIFRKYKEAIRTEIIALENYDETTALLRALQTCAPRAKGVTA